MKRVFSVLLICLCLCGCGVQPAAEPATVPTELTTVPTELTTVPEQTLETTVEVTNGLHSGINDDGSFDEGTLFIGDSLTYGMVTGYLPDNGLLGQAKYMAIPGAAITCYKQGPALGAKPSAYSPQFEGLYMFQAVEAYGEEFTAVYLMLGTNANEYATDKVYAAMVAHLLVNCPNATIYLQLVPNNRSDRVNSEAANGRIQRVYESMPQEDRLQLIDTQTAIGYHLAADGIHLVTEGQQCWYEALVAYAEENEIGR